MRYVAIFIASVMIYGCATPPPPLAANQILVRFESQPSGALIYRDQESQMAPFTSRFTSPTGRGGNMTFTAVWPSGAKTTKTIMMDVNNKNSSITLYRPIDAPGLDVDLAHAMKIQARDDAERARAEAASQAAAQNISNTIDEIAKSRRRSPGITCIKMGDITTCN